MEPLEKDDVIYDLAQALDQISGQRVSGKAMDFSAAELARAFIHSALGRMVILDELSEASGRNRWSLSREFRVLYGTTPYRYMTHRRIELPIAMLTSVYPLAESAISSRFFDQSHLTRQFIQAYGVSPGRWLKRLKLGGGKN